ncbi:hypothetical protein SAMN05428944_8060 [Streptomyces sp. 1222.5]|uniref:hypothetical protein n=1 Tax=unclassified Streptomyces TaxID=2593676 RepID=UPI0008965996|nr:MULTISPECIES: hypothetical protein [unclassified Streptomyces]SED87036.1 hypothetical protein SAMN05428944_8060 [Streptomyces sp. 1222.5]
MRLFVRAVCTSAALTALGVIAFSGAALDGDIGWPSAAKSTPAASSAQDIGWPVPPKAATVISAHDIGWPAVR